MMKKKWIAAIIIYVALLIACIVVIYVVPSLRGMLEKTYVTEYGKIDTDQGRHPCRRTDTDRR